MLGLDRDNAYTIDEINAAIKFVDRFNKVREEYPDRVACREIVKDLCQQFDNDKAKIDFVLSTSHQERYINQKDKFVIFKKWADLEMPFLHAIATTYWGFVKQKEVKDIPVNRKKSSRTKRNLGAADAREFLKLFNENNTAATIIDELASKAREFKLSGKNKQQKVLQMLKNIVENNGERPQGYVPSLFGEVYFELLKQCDDQVFNQYYDLYFAFMAKDDRHLITAGSTNQMLNTSLGGLREMINQSDLGEKVSRAEKAVYAEYLWRALKVVENNHEPKNIERMTALVASYDHAGLPPSSRKRKYLGIMLAILGLIIVGVSYKLLAVSGGTSAAVSLPGISFGKDLITVGSCCYAGMTFGMAMSVGGCALARSSGRGKVSVPYHATQQTIKFFHNDLMANDAKRSDQTRVTIPKKSVGA